jgi:sigma-B regulation protein RsbU (phosphoserine phosphatase)
MGPSSPRCILLCADEPAALDDVRSVLEQVGQPVRLHDPRSAEPKDLSGLQLIVLDSSRADGPTLPFYRRLRARLGDSFIPTLAVADDRAPDARLAGLEAGADTCLRRPFDPDELLAQVKAFLRLKERHDHLAEKAAEMRRLNHRLQAAHQQVNEELDLARRIQVSFLPQVLPEVPRARFAVHYQPCGQVGGDFYDVFRLDEHHVGFYIADAVGHGVPACLLTIFLKKAVRAKEIHGQEYRLLPPDEVLERLNVDLMEQGLAENPFITMVYALLDCRSGLLRFARAGHPYPLYVPADGDPEPLAVSGTLLGVFETRYPVRECRLRPGDKVLFYTDGVEPAGADGSGSGVRYLTARVGRHQAAPVAEFIRHLAAELPVPSEQSDDFTLLGLEVTG